MTIEEIKTLLLIKGYCLYEPDPQWKYWHILNTNTGGIFPAPDFYVLYRWARRIKNRLKPIKS